MIGSTAPVGSAFHHPPHVVRLPCLLLPIPMGRAPRPVEGVHLRGRSDTPRPFGLVLDPIGRLLPGPMVVPLGDHAVGQRLDYCKNCCRKG